MIEAPIPDQEDDRLSILRSYGVLDTPPEERFDRITRLISVELGVPISLVSLIDMDRQWFKSRIGLDATETPRSVAFCSHAILRDEVMTVKDTLEDERFCDNPLVLESPEIRFYAGAPLVTNSGYRLGTLCAIDSRPRELDAREERLLREMAAVVVDELELSAAINALSDQAKRLEERNASLDAFVFSLSHDLAGPIRRIKGLCEMSSEDASSPTGTPLEAIEKSAITADRLLTDLRSFFVVDQAKESEECDLRECVGSALEILSEEIETTNARVEVPDDLPRLQFYPGLLTTLFANLIGNGIKYRSEREPRIKIDAREWDDVWEFSVSDNGLGIAEEFREKVFGLLTRLHRETEIPGSGLGLAICQKIVRAGGGEIRLESTEGEGTCVIFSIPKEVVPSVRGGRQSR